MQEQAKKDEERYLEKLRALSSEESDYLCGSLISLFPVTSHPVMQEPIDTGQDPIDVYTKRLLELAQQGVADAQASMGVLTNVGDCRLPRDPSSALHWLKEAAENGSADAQHTLGVSYLYGKDYQDLLSLNVPQDSNIAMRFLNMAAERGHRNAQWTLAQAYSTGTAKGVSKDLIRAYMWFEILGVKTQLEKLTQIMSADQMEIAKSMAKDWVQKHPQAVR